MANHQEIFTRVQSRLIDTPASIQGEITLLINEAMRALQRDHNFKVMEAISGPHSTTVNTRTLTNLPADWKEARSFPFVVHNLGGVTEISWAPNRLQASKQFSTDEDVDIGAPELLLEAEPSDEAGTAAVEVFPFADGFSDYDNGEYRIYIPYYKYLTALVDPADTNWFTVNFPEYLIAKATSEGFMMAWDEERAALWESKANAKLNEAKLLDKKSRIRKITAMPYYTGARSTRTGT